MRRLLEIIDAVSEWQGLLVSRWFILLITVIVVYDVFMRYVFNSATMWAYETALMLGASFFCMGWSYTQRHQGHIRVDIFYARLTPRWRALIDVVGFLIAFLPFAIFMIIISSRWALRAWAINEKSAETIWYPPIAPLRTIIALGFCLFILQSLAQFIRDFYVLVRKKTYD